MQCFLSTNILFLGVQMTGWEQTAMYQFCMNYSSEKANILNNYQDYPYHNLGKFLRSTAVFICQCLILGEVFIYCRIVYCLTKKNESMQSEGLITKNMQHQRYKKNVITLSGQIITFIVEILCSIFILFQVIYFDLTDPSLMPLLVITVSSIISGTQFVSSPELRRYVTSFWE